MTKFSDFADLCKKLEENTKRNEKINLIASFLKKLREDEIIPTVSFLIGKPFPDEEQQTLDLGSMTLWKISKLGKQTSLLTNQLSIIEVYNQFLEIAKISGKGSKKRKEALLKSILSRCDPLELTYLTRIIVGEMRIGAVEGVVLDAIAQSVEADKSLVRKAFMILGSLEEVAYIALLQGREYLKRIKVKLFRPMRPMLAQMAYSVEEAYQVHGEKTAFEYKLDGARVQIHKKNDKIRVFSRSLSDVTNSLPDIVTLIEEKLNAKEIVVEGEVVAIGRNGKPMPFQNLMRRFRRLQKIEKMIEEIPLRLFLFDILYLNGKMLTETPYIERLKILETLCDEKMRTPRLITEDVNVAKEFLNKAMISGHEGLMAKKLESEYSPGVRGKKWLKIKPIELLDLAIVAADWGYGRRTGWLSNYHLAARSEEGFIVIGKTFKGLTDEEFKSITKQLKKLIVNETSFTVYVKPKIVVEVGFNEIQKSSKYESGFALRFARITRIREDMSLVDVDTIDKVQQLYEKQFKFKAK